VPPSSFFVRIISTGLTEPECRSIEFKEVSCTFERQKFSCSALAHKTRCLQQNDETRPFGVVPPPKDRDRRSRQETLG
jgi:hypothetical protein